MIVALVWLWITMFIVGFYPIIDGRQQLLDVWIAMREGKWAKGAKDGGVSVETSSGERTPTERVEVRDEKA
jgi:urea-proton symporter